MASGAKAFMRDVWKLAWPYWVSEERWAARGLLAAIITLNLGTVAVSVLINRWQARFYNALADKDVSAFMRQLGEFGVLAAAFILMAVYQLYLNQMLQIRWRRWLTRLTLRDWLSRHAYYYLELIDRGTDNPDQRISEDLRAFVDITLYLVLGLLNAGVTLAAFVVVLWGLSGELEVPVGGERVFVVGGYLVWAALLYAMVGSLLAHKIGRPLIRLNFDQQRYEADFRFSLVRLRENAESIAFYRGEAGEERMLAERFGWVFRNWWAIMRAQKRLMWFTSGYAQISVVFPIVVVSPRYFAGLIQLGQLMQTVSAFGQVQGSLSWFVDAYPQIAQWKAVVDRLLGFREGVERSRRRDDERSGFVFETRPGGPLALDGVNVRLPDGRPLLSQIRLQVTEGEWVLLTGRTGTGKSTLLRVLAGIWPFGEGRIRVPTEARFLFLPQKPYLPVGTLREVVCYPGAAEEFDDKALVEALGASGLDHLSGRLTESQVWSMQLSGGEQQRVAFARVLLHRPDWLFLDEASSALDEATEQAVYAALKERLPRTAVVSVGHRRALFALHGRSFALKADGGGPSALHRLEDGKGPEVVDG
jgi:vitamin B12/bleomycin/antimicrobial peptide transport system ATP-binding/permease protein